MSVNEEIEGKVYLVTGGNTGIGYITARELARRGGRVVLACRSEDKARLAIAKITEETGSTALDFLRLDLSSLGEVKKSTEQFIASNISLDCLINNAGMIGRGYSVDGFERQFAVNHLGPYLFTRLLLSSGVFTAPSRIVHVASRAHTRVRGMHWKSLRKTTKTRTGFQEYCVSKLANVLFSMELAKRLPAGVKSYALHPGVIKSDIWRRVPWPIRPLMQLGMISVEEGATTSIYCATEVSLAAETGLYYANCRRSEQNVLASDELALELWQRSETWCAGYL